MLGAIIGDIVGSRFEWKPNKNKEFEYIHIETKFVKPVSKTLLKVL